MGDHSDKGFNFGNLAILARQNDCFPLTRFSHLAYVFRDFRLSARLFRASERLPFVLESQVDFSILE